MRPQLASSECCISVLVLSSEDDGKGKRGIIKASLPMTIHEFLLDKVTSLVCLQIACDVVDDA